MFTCGIQNDSNDLSLIFLIYLELNSIEISDIYWLLLIYWLKLWKLKK